MPNSISKNIAGIFIHGILSAVLLWPLAAAQEDPSATRQQQAAQLRAAVEARIGELDQEYAARAAELRGQFDARMREIEETVESEFELSNAMVPISRVYQDSLAALQREISSRKDSAYVAQRQANDELNRLGAITPETWARISSTPLSEFRVSPEPAADDPAVARDATSDELADTAAAGAAIPAATAPPPSGCEIAWFPDRDKDLFGDGTAAMTLACYPDKPAGFVDNDYDCDDSDPTVNPITGRCTPAQ